MATESCITRLIYGIVNAVLFGTGANTVLPIPRLRENWKSLIPIVVALSFARA